MTVLLQLRFPSAIEQEPLPGAIRATTLEVWLQKQPGAHAMVWLLFDVRSNFRDLWSSSF